MYNPPEHVVQQPQLYNNPPATPSYTSWSTIPPQTPSTLMNSTINCWSLTPTPPPPHQISAQNTPNQSPTHQIYQPITNLTNLSTYPSYYNHQDIAYTHYQSTPEYLPIMNAEITYNDNRQTNYHNPEDHQESNKSETYEDGNTLQTNENSHHHHNNHQHHDPDSPDSNASSTTRHEWTNTQNHVS